MCLDPVTMTVMASAAVSAIGGAISNVNEAAVAGANARNALTTGLANENQYRDEARQKIAQQLANLSNRGMSVSTGAPLASLADTAKKQELDALQIRANAENQAAIYKTQEKSFNNSAIFSAAGALLGGAVKLADLGKLGGAAGGGDPGAGGAGGATGG